MPGGIDAHVHFDQDTADGSVFCNDFESGSRAVAAGGTTTIIPVAYQSRGQGLRDVVDRYHKRADCPPSHVSNIAMRSRMLDVICAQWRAAVCGRQPGTCGDSECFETDARPSSGQAISVDVGRKDGCAILRGIDLTRLLFSGDVNRYWRKAKTAPH